MPVGACAHQDAWLTSAVRNCKASSTQFIQTLGARRRYLPDIMSKDSSRRLRAERQAVNSICQVWPSRTSDSQTPWCKHLPAFIQQVVVFVPLQGFQFGDRQRLARVCLGWRPHEPARKQHNTLSCVLPHGRLPCLPSTRGQPCARVLSASWENATRGCCRLPVERSRV